MVISMNKRTGTAAIILISICMMAGCGAKIPEMTDEQTALVTEYAANLLIKYNAVPGRSLLNDEQMKAAEEKAAEEAEKQKKREEAAQAYLAAKEAADQNKESASGTDGTGTTSGSQNTIPDLAAFYGLEGFTVAYDGYELCSSYPDESRDDYFLAMDATDGKQLCIIKFQITNVSDAQADLDMFQNQAVFYLTIDGGNRIQMQSTLLLDDLASYKGMIEAGASEKMVLVFEIPDSVSQFGSLELMARFGDKKGTMILQ